MNMRRRGRWPRAALLVLVLAALALPVAGCGALERAANSVNAPEPFPTIDRAGLTAAQSRIVDVLEQQYEKNPAGTVYSEGEDQPWCADFASWVMRQSGVPFRNPNSGSWRIPGVATLTDYFRSIRRLHSPDRAPHVGDVVIYAPPHQLGQHVNVVVAVAGDQMTTVGGNEGRGVTLRTARWSGVDGIVGFGAPQ